MHHQWLLLAACFWVIFMFMVASKFITLTFKDPDVYGARQEFLLLTTMPEVRKLPEEKHIPEELKPTGKELPDSRLVQPLVYMERLELIRNVCRDDALKNLSHTPVSKFVLDRIFVCDKHRILFCQTPKVGNTQWKKVLIVLNGAFPSIEEIPENVVHDHEKNGLPRLSSFSDAEIQKRLKTYFKFFIVRDPFERLISAFKDKFVHNPRFEPWYRHEIAPGIIRKYRRNRTETRGIQFEDFVRYLGDPNHRWLDLQFGDHIIHWVTNSTQHSEEGQRSKGTAETTEAFAASDLRNKTAPLAFIWVLLRLWRQSILSVTVLFPWSAMARGWCGVWGSISTCLLQGAPTLELKTSRGHMPASQDSVSFTYFDSFHLSKMGTARAISHHATILDHVTGRWVTKFTSNKTHGPGSLQQRDFLAAR
uniref:Carbohydrate sulfotransferase n=1 Tax=Papio anubis TaxID=9555 RepID=A0A8I5NLW7_PAPAN